MLKKKNQINLHEIQRPRVDWGQRLEFTYTSS
jgi:hypothetical protein